jgi:pre-rRNA-processing protein IPI1
MSTKRRSGGQAPDFKRLKSKVGKRALKPANETDTSFKAASLHLAGQSIDKTLVGNTIVASTRGKTIFELSAQLGHPAAAARLSAIKGLGDIARNQPPYLLRPHLSILIPTCTKSWVDEDDEVRTAGLSAFGDLLGQQSDTSVRPFISLIIAYFTSALHSLDPQMRVDGARAVKLLCSVHPSLIRPFISKMLQPFIGLLTDRNKLKSNEEILQALLSLLEVSIEKRDNHDENDATNRQPDLTFVVGGRSKNTLLLEKRKSKHSTKPFFSLQDFPTFEVLEQMESSTFYTGSFVDELSVIYEVLEKLRDILLENVEEDDFESTGKRSSGPPKAEKLLLIVRSIGILWKRKTQFCTMKSVRDSEKLDNLAVQNVTVLLDIFPFRQSNDSASSENLNSAICTTVMDISSSVSTDLFIDYDGSTLDWMERLSSFLLPRLHHYTQDKNYSSTALKVFCDLLMLSFKISDFPEANRLSMLERLQNVFFDTEDVTLARSPAGRKVVLVLADILEHLQYRIDTEMQSFGETLKYIVLKLSFYLRAWGSDFDYESNSILCIFHGIGRRNCAEDKIIEAIQDGMARIVVGSGKKKSKQSIFESYPLQTQRRFLAVMVMLEKPSSDVLRGLASICAKSTNHREGENVNISLADEIVASLQSIRRSIPMKNYLMFLLNSITTPPTASKKKQSPDTETTSFDFHMQRMHLFDLGVSRITRALIQCGSSRVLQMLLPYLSSLLDTKSGFDSIDEFLRTRVALSMFAMLSLDAKHVTNEYALPSNIEPGLGNSIFQSIVFISSSDSSMSEKAKLLSPIIALFQIEPTLFLSLVDSIVDKFDEYKARKSIHNNMIQLLIETVGDRRLVESISGFHQLSSSVQALEFKLKKERGPRNDLVGHLKALLEIKI